MPLFVTSIGGGLVTKRAEDPVLALLGIVILPAVSASLLCIAFVSPASAIERSVPAPTMLLEVAHYLASAVVPNVVLIAFASEWQVGAPAWILRNACGYHGLAILGVAVLGAELAWIVPVVYSIAVATVVLQQAGDLSGMSQSPWLWPVLPDAALGAGFAGPALLVAGIALVTVHELRR